MCAICGPDGVQQSINHDIGHPFELRVGTDMQCSECGLHLSAHPDKFEFMARKQMDDIIRVGHQVICVFGDDEGPGFAYTVGRTMKDRPELLITGSLPIAQLQMILNSAAAYDDEHILKAGAEVPAETMLSCPVRIVEVGDLRAAQMFDVLNNFGMQNPTGLQVVWPDADGNFPGDAEFAYGADAQPVYS